MRNRRRRYLLVLCDEKNNTIRTVTKMRRRGKLSLADIIKIENAFGEKYNRNIFLTNVVEL